MRALSIFVTSHSYIHAWLSSFLGVCALATALTGWTRNEPMHHIAGLSEMQHLATSVGCKEIQVQQASGRGASSQSEQQLTDPEED